MEQKTIGKFITALRKANGMTQKDLAEKLNVSDKTISRWERDDGAPDLSLIPVIAEIFGVTCDELLRGERKPAAERSDHPAEPTAKGEKQRQRILTLSLSKFRTQSFISIGISLVGLIAAMICNLGFNRGYIGFFVGSIFYVASQVCQAIFLNNAFLSVSDEEIAGGEAARFKTAVIGLAKQSVFITLTLLGGTLPLLLFPYDAYAGLEMWSWLVTGLIFGIGMLIICAVAWYFLHARLLRNGVCTLGEKETAVYWHNHRLKRTFAVILVAVLGVTLIGQCVVNEMWSSWDLVEGTEFYDYDSFVAFMEQDVSYIAEGSIAPEPSDSIYYDEFGNEIAYEELFREEVIVADGTPEGKVVCTFVHRNYTVSGWRVADTGDGLPITVITHSDLDAAQAKLTIINVTFGFLYLLELLAVGLIYRRKRMK